MDFMHQLNQVVLDDDDVSPQHTVESSTSSEIKELMRKLESYDK